MTRRKKTKKRKQRDVNTPITYREMLFTEQKLIRHDLTKIEDNRLSGARDRLPAQTVFGTKARIKPDNRRIRRKTFNPHMRFEDPTRVVRCQRRKERRETLFKKQKIGKGRKVSKIRKRNKYSDVRC